MKTYSLKEKDIDNKWHVIDAADQTLGRLATKVAGLLMGKHKPTYSPQLAMGDYVIVVNAEKVKTTGNKLEKKIYYRHTGYMGGIKQTTQGKLMEKRPTRVIELAVKGMLPKTKLGRQLYGRLKVYPGPDHPHKAQIETSEQKDQL